MSRRAEGTVDEAATAWICGVFLYCMLCNQYPVRACPQAQHVVCRCLHICPWRFCPICELMTVPA